MLHSPALPSSPLDHPQPPIPRRTPPQRLLHLAWGPEGGLFHRGTFKKSGGCYILQCLGTWRNSSILAKLLTFFLTLQLQAVQSSLPPSRFSRQEASIVIHVHRHHKLLGTHKIIPRTLSSHFPLLGCQP